MLMKIKEIIWTKNSWLATFNMDTNL